MIGASTLALALLSVTASAQAKSSKCPARRCDAACAELLFALDGRVSLPHSPTYELESSHYWSLQQATQLPACRVAPTSAEDVSVALTVLKANNCLFAVKSGGHSSFAGASNIGSDGVTIDLSKLTQLEVSNDRKQVSVGAGRLWSSVYLELDAKNLSVIGGRSGDIGVGGLTLGGGISYFSGRYGWACDNVNNYEVVFADGTIRDVNKKSYPDLYFALRGGGNNFGIVTRFDLASFDQGKFWGGQLAYAADNLPALNEALFNFNINHYQDPFGAVILAYVYVSSANVFAAGLNLEYGKPVENPRILANFTSLSPIPNTSTMRITNMTDLALELNASQPAGFRETFWTFTTKNNVQLMADIQDLFASEISGIANASHLLPALAFQPISAVMIKHFSSNGGNALGITDEEGPLILVDISIAWSDVKDDERILRFAKKFINDGMALAKKRGLYNRYIYQNYAAAGQQVFAGYGPENHAKLRRIYQKYDPTGVFTKLQPGYFKI